MSKYTGRMALSVFRKSSPPRTQLGPAHRQVIQKLTPSPQNHIRIFDASHGLAARLYASYLKEAEAARAHGETPPEDPVPDVSVQSGIVRDVIVGRGTVQRLVAQLPTDEIPPGYHNGWRDFLSETAAPSAIPPVASESEAEMDEALMLINTRAVANAQVIYDGKPVMIKTGRITVYDDNSVYLVNDADGAAYPVAEEVAVACMVAIDAACDRSLTQRLVSGLWMGQWHGHASSCIVATL